MHMRGLVKLTALLCWFRSAVPERAVTQNTRTKIRIAAVFKVCETKCDQCLFSKDKIVSNARMKEVLAECRSNDSHFICHKTEDTCCRGFFDTRTSQMIRIAGRLNMIEFVQIK